MIDLHIISDLNLGFNEFSLAEEDIPDVDLVIINGNIGLLKRAMLYIETICKKYPTTQFVYNLGELELYKTAHEKFLGEIDEQLKARQSVNQSWPKNLHYKTESFVLKLRNNVEVDMLCLYGFPKLHKIEMPWEQTNWHKFYTMGNCDDEHPEGKFYKPIGTSNVRHGGFPLMADINWVNNRYLQEETKARNWELTNNNARKILVTHINPYKDTRLINQKYSPYQIHLYNQIWISSNTHNQGLQFLGGKLYSNPGRGPDARSQVITIQ